MSLTRLEYFDEVMRILESFDYPSLVCFYNPHQVASSIGYSVLSIWEHGESPMMCAVIIWSATMNYQIIPDMKASVKH
jgi:hypothetical protein